MDQLAPGSSLSQNVDPGHLAKRECIWAGGTFGLRLHDWQPGVKSPYLGRMFVHLKHNRSDKHGLTSSFLHDGEKTVRWIYKHLPQNRLIFCDVSVWRVSRPDGQVSFYLDYFPVAGASSTRTLKVMRREEADKMPDRMGGTIISITLPKNAGFILIGDRVDPVVEGTPAEQLADVRYQNQ